MVELEMRMPMPLAKGKPDGETPGWVGLIAMDVTDPERTVYKCVTASAGVYTWVPMSTGGGGVSGGDYILTDADKSEIAGVVIDMLPATWVLSLRVTTPANGNVIAELYKDGVICTDRMYLRTYVSSQGGEWRAHGTGSGYFTGKKSWSYGGGDEGVAWKCEVYADENMTERLALASAATGTKGDPGSQGPRGERGADGSAGANGVSATHSWNGTVLTVTSASGTSSADLKGAKGDPGYTPQKGVDYFTAADKAEIAAAAAAEVDTSGLVPKTGATMEGALVAQTNANYTTRQTRNVIYLEEGATVPTTQNGDLVLFYK